MKKNGLLLLFLCFFSVGCVPGAGAMLGAQIVRQAPLMGAGMALNGAGLVPEQKRHESYDAPTKMISTCWQEGGKQICEVTYKKVSPPQPSQQKPRQNDNGVTTPHQQTAAVVDCENDPINRMFYRGCWEKK